MPNIPVIIIAILAAALVAWILLRKRTGAARQADVSAPNAPSETLENGRRRIPESEHQIPRRYLDDNAMKVVYRLEDADHEGYLVGGCIRDLLRGLKPKDFDIATSAHPEEAEELFRRGRLIGRRFKLLHVRFGREVIEVATFRASHDQGEAGREQARTADTGMILRDNVYGTIEEDALRRDFTVNALYYDAKDHSILDFAGGYDDLKNNRLRMIGDANARYREDPVRMLRAARFAAKLGFEIESDTAEPIRELAPLMRNVSPARLFDEVLKLLQSGHGEASYRQLQRFGLFQYLFPLTDQALESDDYPVETLLINALCNTDRRLAQNKSVTPAFLFAALLWYPLQLRMRELEAAGTDLPPIPLLHEAANQVLGEQVKCTAIPRRFSTPVREIWELQLRLPRRQGKKADQLMEHPRFRAAYDLLLLRENSGEDLGGLSQWWTDYQVANPVSRREMMPEEQSDRPKRKRRRRPRKRPNQPPQGE
ncbi:polynucleotide adenylyltransferase PcnB [Marinobacterium weihaiense]|uniref:Poly(A) polymerase I n=1 Tax=Marinobacterium weihaiense TaxID=2851016 RepID=A0ABS6MDA6_9GAMM|nr:polynucleotide adenylyltransferase PcnB [Marinobacterium weihaiense]MBV0934210.1 polynucleotide adenylyltransferase PcnB [Marinobacterium weihaiense]